MIPGVISRVTESEVFVANTIHAKTDVIFLRGSGAIQTIHPGLGVQQGQMLILWCEGNVILQPFGNINTGLQEFSTGRHLPMTLPRYRATVLLFLKRFPSWMVVQGGSTVASGVLHHWTLNDASGSTAVDAAGGAHGTIFGGVTLNQPGHSGVWVPNADASMSFDGTGGILIDAPLPPAPASVTAWIKTTNNVLQPVISGRRETLPSHAFLGMGVGGFILASTVNSAAVGTRVVNDGIWHHVAWVFTSDNCWIFIDGTYDTAVPIAPRQAISPIASIAWDGKDNSFWVGGLDEVAIWPIPLNGQQISLIYQFGISTYMKEHSG